MDWLIEIAGVAGLLIAGYGLVSVALRARRTRRYCDIAVAVVVAVAVVAALLAFGERLVW